MGGLFGKEKKSRITEQDQAILKLKKQRDQLKLYQRRIQAVLEKDREIAKKLLQEGKKDRAKLLLRKKKYQEGLLDRAEGQLNNIEQLVHDLEFAQIEKQVLDGLKSGNEALKKANEMFSIEEIENILEDTKEAIDKQKEIDALLSGGLSQGDEDEVLEELEALVVEEQKRREEEEEEEVELPNVPEEIPLPEVPSASPKEAKKEAPRIALEASS